MTPRSWWQFARCCLRLHDWRRGRLRGRYCRWCGETRFRLIQHPPVPYGRPRAPWWPATKETPQ